MYCQTSNITNQTTNPYRNYPLHNKGEENTENNIGKELYQNLTSSYFFKDFQVV